MLTAVRGQILYDWRRRSLFKQDAHFLFIDESLAAYAHSVFIFP